MMTRVFLFLTLALCLFGCGGMQKNYEETYCNRNGGFEKGMNEATSGEPMSSRFFSRCPKASLEAALNGYREGYDSGIKARAASLPKVQVNVGSAPAGRAFVCEMRAASTVYSAFGATQLNAEKAVRSDCERGEGSAFSCKEVSCRKNQ